MKKWTSLFVLMLVTLNVLSVVVYSADSEYIEKNGVKLYSISNTQVQGYVNIQGETTKNKIKLMVVKSNEQIWYDLKLENGRFNQKLWLNSGKGTYTVYVMINEYDSQLYFLADIY